MAVLLVEKTAYEADLSKLQDEMSANVAVKKKAHGVRQSSIYPKASKSYAAEHGVLRGDSSGKNDKVEQCLPVPLDSGSIDEGLYTLVQTGTCRREVLTKIFGNNKSCTSQFRLQIT